MIARRDAVNFRRKLWQLSIYYVCIPLWWLLISRTAAAINGTPYRIVYIDYCGMPQTIYITRCRRVILCCAQRDCRVLLDRYTSIHQFKFQRSKHRSFDPSLWLYRMFVLYADLLKLFACWVYYNAYLTRFEVDQSAYMQSTRQESASCTICST